MSLLQRCSLLRLPLSPHPSCFPACSLIRTWCWSLGVCVNSLPLRSTPVWSIRQRTRSFTPPGKKKKNTCTAEITTATFTPSQLHRHVRALDPPSGEMAGSSGGWRGRAPPPAYTHRLVRGGKKMQCMSFTEPYSEQTSEWNIIALTCLVGGEYFISVK